MMLFNEVFLFSLCLVYFLLLVAVYIPTSYISFHGTKKKYMTQMIHTIQTQAFYPIHTGIDTITKLTSSP